MVFRIGWGWGGGMSIVETGISGMRLLMLWNKTVAVEVKLEIHLPVNWVKCVGITSGFLA